MTPPGNAAHAEEFYQLVVQLNSIEGGFHVSKEELEQHILLIKRVALCAKGQVSPVCALLGGVLGQEVLKAVSGKFTPIKQWFYYDGSDSLPEQPLSAGDPPRYPSYMYPLSPFSPSHCLQMTHLGPFLYMLTHTITITSQTFTLTTTLYISPSPTLFPYPQRKSPPYPVDTTVKSQCMAVICRVVCHD